MFHATYIKMNHKEGIKDELLVLRCQEGDAAAFEELLERWQDRLWRHAWRLTGDEDAAWDAMQETWLNISRDIRRLRSPAAFRAWAYRIATNKCKDWIRKEARTHQAAEHYSEEVSRAEIPQNSLTLKEQSESLSDAISRLPGKDRTILSLKYEEDFDIAEIAAILDIPEGTVKSRLHYAREHLKKILERKKNG